MVVTIIFATSADSQNAAKARNRTRVSKEMMGKAGKDEPVGIHTSRRPPSSLRHPSKEVGYSPKQSGALAEKNSCLFLECISPQWFSPWIRSSAKTRISEYAQAQKSVFCYRVGERGVKNGLGKRGVKNGPGMSGSSVWRSWLKMCRTHSELSLSSRHHSCLEFKPGWVSWTSPPSCVYWSSLARYQSKGLLRKESCCAYIEAKPAASINRYRRST